MATAKDALEVIFTFGKSTKRTYVFNETIAKLNGETYPQEVFPVVYVKQSAFAKGQPKGIKITLEAIY